MTLFLIAFLAGVLTVLAPCILPLLPIVVGGAAADHADRRKLFVITGSLVLSVVVFTLLLKASTLFIDIPPSFWTYFSGGILVALGLVLLFPTLWERLPVTALLNRKGNELLATGTRKKSVWGDVLMGAALGPVFSTCSPTYFVILATVLPSNFTLGLLYLFAYALGLAFMLIAIGYLGQRLVGRLTGAADPHGWVKRGMGVLITLVGLAVLTGFDKKVETAILDAGFFDVTKIEQTLLEQAPMPGSSTEGERGTLPTLTMPTGEVGVSGEFPQGEQSGTSTGSSSEPRGATGTEDAERTSPPLIEPQAGPKAPELAGISAYLNTDGKEITLAGYRNNKVVLLDFWTYSCINCKRTQPYLNAWHERYGDRGLVIVGVHTPEFAFEQKRENVEQALRDQGIKYPVVLDNRYWTWTAFGNRFWPRKYLIDIDGTIVYDHIGEGKYDETEAKIVELLEKRASIVGYREGAAAGTPSNVTEVDFNAVNSPETYFGAKRNSNLGNGIRSATGVQSFMAPSALILGKLYLDGTWSIVDEFAEVHESNGSIKFRFSAKNVYMVLASDAPQSLTVSLDGEPINRSAGKDVFGGTLTVAGERLYHVIELDDYGTHTLEISVPTGVRVYTFTFG